MCTLGVDGVDDATVIAPGTQQPDALEVREMCRERGRANVELRANLAGRQTFRARGDQETKDLEPQLMRQRSEGIGVHASYLREMTEYRQAAVRRNGARSSLGLPVRARGVLRTGLQSVNVADAHRALDRGIELAATFGGTLRVRGSGSTP